MVLFWIWHIVMCDVILLLEGEITLLFPLIFSFHNWEQAHNVTEIQRVSMPALGYDKAV